jgi:hypothetical protein
MKSEADLQWHGPVQFRHLSCSTVSKPHYSTKKLVKYSYLFVHTNADFAKMSLV